MKTYIKRPKAKLEYGNEALKREMMVLVGQLGDLDFVPNVERIACDSKGLYLELEFFEGETIKQIMKKERRFGPGTLEFWEVLSERLGLVHEEGVVHHDVSSGNVMVRGIIYENNPAILDFGFSNVFDLMREGYTVGNVRYMAPEQSLGFPFPYDVNDVRCDIYSLGALMYYCFSGKPVFTVPPQLKPKLDNFQRSQFVAKMHVIAKPEPLHMRRANFPLELSNVIMKCLEKNPEERFETAFDLSFALREVRKNL